MTKDDLSIDSVAKKILICFSCKSKQDITLGVRRRDECSNCGADLHVCLNCRFYDKSAYNECREPSAEVVRDKDRSNFCDFFEPGRDGNDADEKKQDLLSAAEALFKK